MNRDILKIVVVGHVDHGKSALIGRLLFDTNSLSVEKIAEIKRISKELDKEAELAYLTDQFKEERENNLTIDTTQIFFKTKRRGYVIIDAPGHVEFIKNMITGITLAEAAVLIVDVEKGLEEQTKRHACIIDMLGIGQLIVVLNKMDLVDYKKEEFSRVKAELLRFLEDLGIKPSFIIPVSAREGINISQKNSKMSWHKGLNLLEALDLLEIEDNVSQRPLRFPVQDIYRIDGEEIIAGRIASGEIKQGQRVFLLPRRKETRVKIVKSFGRHKKIASQGENIGLVLDGSEPVKRGCFIVRKENSPEITERFRGNIFWMGERPLQINKRMMLRCATQEVECFAEKISRRINSATLEIIEENAGELTMNEAGVVVFKTKEPVILEKFSDIEELGRFVIEVEHNPQGAGIVTDKIMQ